MQNEAGSCEKKWHKSDTTGSASVPALARPETETAAQAGDLNGGNTVGKESAGCARIFYHDGDSPAMVAGRWYAENRAVCPHPVIPALRRQFGLSPLQAVQAIGYAKEVSR